ncbi:hypothetical protein [Hoeflea phototrophica]|jgi:hypothetical protein|uniref:hypothetical protein n=1 Tax=Hoeflea phototrophica TaxID=244596 RepID=UPI0012EB56ED|nr:hypothetical protein [Hoeflea phototrophica]
MSTHPGVAFLLIKNQAVRNLKPAPGSRQDVSDSVASKNAQALSPAVEVRGTADQKPGAVCSPIQENGFNADVSQRCTVLALLLMMRSYDLKRGAPNTCLSMKC